VTQSHRLSLREIQAAFRLIGECVELGADPTLWTTHLFEGLCQLAGAVAAIGGQTEGFLVDQPCRVILLIRTGRSADAWRSFDRYTAMEGYRVYDAALQRLRALLGTQVTASHEQLYTRSEWLRSVLFNEFFRANDFNDRLLSFCLAPQEQGRGAQIWSGITLYRGLEDRPFTARQRRLVHFIHTELQPLLGTRLALGDGSRARPLSPRLRQVLNLLLQGRSEKEVARACDLSKATIHEYVTALYERYGVHSRAELLALFLQWPARTLLRPDSP
jgi:DNA-binding CsgD family transcriptional regulator